MAGREDYYAISECLGYIMDTRNKPAYTVRQTIIKGAGGWKLCKRMVFTSSG